MELVWITQAQHESGHILRLTFNDGVEVRYDFDQLIKSHPKTYGPLADPEVFAAFQLDGWTVNWCNGAIDVAPEKLYHDGTPTTPMAAEPEEEYRISTPKDSDY